MKSIIYFSIAIVFVLLSSLPVSAVSLFSCADVAEIPQIECEVLVALYNSTNGPGWWDSTNWLVTNTLSSWYGVTLNSGHVYILALQDNHLIGSLPAELGNLTNLSGLYLPGNKLSGRIPVELGSITQLGQINLGWNQLSGTIPPELGNLSELDALHLEYNQLSGSLPPELGNLTLLTSMSLAGNQLSGTIPPEFGKLTSLRLLDLSYNQLNGIIPPELDGLTSLNYLYLDYNQLGGSIPSGLFNLTSQKYIYLDHNQLIGTLPLELGNLVNLERLDLHCNLLSGNLPDVVGNLTLMKYLDLSGNQLTDSIPDAVGSLVNLNLLHLQDNQLEGSIPPSFIYLTNLFDPSKPPGADGLDLDYNLLNIPPGYPDPNDPLQVFLSQKDPDWQLYQGFEQVIGTGGGELTSLDGRTDILIPEGALITDTTFTFIPRMTPHHSSPGLVFLHNSFELTAEDAGGNSIIFFTQPVTVTLTYTDADLGAIAEDSLGLYYWDSAASTWTDAVTTCPGGEYTRDPAGNLLVLPVCHLTEFGLFGIPLNVFMPIIRR